MNRILYMVLISMLCIMVVVAYNFDNSGSIVNQDKTCCTMDACSSKTDCRMKK